MFDRERTTPTSWLHVAGFVLVLWAVSSDALAQARALIVSDVRGTVQRNAGAVAQPARLLDAVKPGERFRLSSDSMLSLYSQAEAIQYVIEGPAEVAVTAKGVLAHGKAVAPQRLEDAYRSVKLNSGDLVQGSLVMRNAEGMLIESPTGALTMAEARTLRWKGGEAWIVEVAKESGDLVYRAAARGGSHVIPATVMLEPGIRYVWGLRRSEGVTDATDWTEFRIDDVPPARASRVVQALWLRENGMPRAALRELQAAR